MSEDTRDLDLGEDIETLAGESPFSAEQQAQLKSALDPHMGSRMKTGGKKKINGQWQDEKASYLETNVVIDQANAIFGFGNWSYELLAEPTFELDDPDLPLHSGVYYAMVRVSVRGCLPTVELGAQPMKIGYEQSGDPKKANGAQRRMARQGAVSAGLKRGLRHFGNQFGNSLYSKDSEIHALIEQAERDDEQAQRRPTPAPQPPRQPAPRPTPPPRSAPTGNTDPWNVHGAVHEEVAARQLYEDVVRGLKDDPNVEKAILAKGLAPDTMTVEQLSQTLTTLRDRAAKRAQQAADAPAAASATEQAPDHGPDYDVLYAVISEATDAGELFRRRREVADARDSKRVSNDGYTALMKLLNSREAKIGKPTAAVH